MKSELMSPWWCMLPDSTGAHCRLLLLEDKKPVLQCTVFCDNWRWQCTINEEDAHDAPIFRQWTCLGFWPTMDGSSTSLTKQIIKRSDNISASCDGSPIMHKWTLSWMPAGRTYHACSEWVQEFVSIVRQASWKKNKTWTTLERSSFRMAWSPDPKIFYFDAASCTKRMQICYIQTNCSIVITMWTIKTILIESIIDWLYK